MLIGVFAGVCNLVENAVSRLKSKDYCKTSLRAYANSTLPNLSAHMRSLFSACAVSLTYKVKTLSVETVHALTTLCIGVVPICPKTSQSMHIDVVSTVCVYWAEVTIFIDQDQKTDENKVN